MDADKKDEITGAQLQIERLMKLKVEKDKKDKIRMENAGGAETAVSDPAKAKPLRQKHEAKPAAGAASKKKAANIIKVEKRLYEKLHKLVNALNITGGGKITKAKFVNIVLKEFLDLDIDFNVVKSKDEIKRIFDRLKTGN